MATNKSGNRYSGTDSVGWFVKDTSGKPVLLNKDGGPEAFTVFKDANAAAKRFTENTGVFAQPVRS